jgi:hypothetical protein
VGMIKTVLRRNCCYSDILCTVGVTSVDFATGGGLSFAQIIAKNIAIAIRYFRKFDPQFGTEFEDILVSCLVLQLSENSDIHCTTHAEFPPPRAPRRDYYLSPRTTLERANFNIIPPHFVLVFKSSNTPQFIRQCRFARRLARLRIVMSVDL